MAVREGSFDGGLDYLAAGSGPPLVVFVGLTAEHANPTGLMRRFAVGPFLPLAEHFTVYLANRKRGLEPGSSLQDIAGHYARGIEREFDGPVHVVGTSTGGAVAQQFAVDHPHLVDRLVLVATACRLSSRGREVQRRAAAQTVAGRHRRAWAAMSSCLTATDTTGRLMAGVSWLMGNYLAADDPSDMLVTIAAEDRFDGCGDLQRITASTLVIGGERDRFYSTDLFRQTAAGIPDARLTLLPGASHMGTFSSKAAIAEILAFLSDERARATDTA